MTATPGRRRRVLVIAYYFPPLGSSGTFRTLKFVKYLHGLGWDSVVVTVDPQYEQLEPVDTSLLSEVPEGTVVIRTAAWRPARTLARWFRRRSNGPSTATSSAKSSPSAPKQSGWRGRARTLARGFGRGGWYPFAAIAALKAVWRHDVDVVYTSGPPFTSSLVGFTVKRLTGRPLVSDFRDPWGVNTYHDEADSLVNRLSLFLERRTFAASNRIINISPDLEEKAKRRSPARLHDRFAVIPNGFDPDDVAGAAGTKPAGEFRVTYTGCFYPGSREPFKFLESLTLLRERDRGTFDSVHAHFVGEPGWADEHRAWLNGLELDGKVTFHRFLPHREAVGFLQASDVLLMLGSVKAEDTGSLPAKLFEYLAVGKPILALVHDGESARFVRASGIGVVANPQRPEEIAAALSQLASAMRSGQFERAVNRELLRRHDRRCLAEQLAGVFDAVTGSGATVDSRVAAAKDTR